MKTKGIILAAGRGRRMNELTSDRPKCFTSVKGKKLIDYQLDAFHEVGVNEVAIATGYRHPDFEKFPTQKFHNPEWSTTNMFYTLCCARSWLQKHPCIISYSDIIYNSSIVSDLVNADGDICVAYDPNWLDLWSKRFDNPLDDAETFDLAGEYIATIGGRASSLSEINGQYMGLLKFMPSGWHKINTLILNQFSEEKLKRLDMTTMLNELINKGIKLKAIPLKGCWFEFDLPSDLQAYDNLPAHMQLNLSQSC